MPPSKPAKMDGILGQVFFWVVLVSILVLLTYTILG